MTHNLRTPLASIKAAVSTLQDTAGRARSRHAGASAADCARRSRTTRAIGEQGPGIEPNSTRACSNLGESPPMSPSSPGARYIGSDNFAARDRVQLSVAGDVLVVSADPEMIELVLVWSWRTRCGYAPMGTEVAVIAERTAVPAGARSASSITGRASLSTSGRRCSRNSPGSTASTRQRRLGAWSRDRAGVRGRARRDDPGRRDPGGGATLVIVLPDPEPAT